MKVRVLLFLLGVLLMAACSAPEAEAPEVPFQTYSIDQFLKTTSVGGGDFNSDETRLLIHSNETGIFNAYTVDIATGEKVPVTQSESESVFAVGFVPGTEKVMYTSDKGGNEIYHLFMQDREGVVTELTAGDETRESFYGFSHDLKSFFTGITAGMPGSWMFTNGIWKPWNPACYIRMKTDSISPDKSGQAVDDLAENPQ